MVRISSKATVYKIIPNTNPICAVTRSLLQILNVGRSVINIINMTGTASDKINNAVCLLKAKEDVQLFLYISLEWA
jgi:hypothetical protein